jgi:subtilisin family serine protease
MGKRAAGMMNNGFGRRLRAVLAALPSTRGPAKADNSNPELVEMLEPRVLLSTSAAVVSVTWHGETVQAYQNQYVTETKNSAKFQQLISTEGFTDVTSLGSNFYEFTSTLPIAELEKLGAAYPVALADLEPNYYMTLQSTTSNDQYLSDQWGLENTGQIEPYDYQGNGVVTPYNEVQNPTPPSTIEFPSPPYPNDNKAGVSGDDIDATQAWDITTGSPNVVVAVLDSGIDPNQPDLVSNLWTNPLDTAANNDDGDGYPDDIHGWSTVNNSADITDENGHGTNVSGIIGASGNNGIGVTGVNWNVKILPVQVADANGAVSDSELIAGIEYVVNLKDRGINIVAMNESLGFQDFPIDVLQSDAVRLAGKAGILDIVAAGNSSLNLDNSSIFPAKFSLSDPTVITVAAVDDQFDLAYFSNYGATSVDLAAPGVDIYSTSPTYAVTLNTEVAQEPDIPQFPVDYGYLSGTSQATPFVTGIIALEAAANPSATPAELKAALLDGVTYDPALAASNGQPAKVLTSGVANAYKAVENILNYSTGTNTTRGGSWQNYYGDQGSYVVGESTESSGIADVSISGGTPVVLDNTTTSQAGLQYITDAGTRISAYEASATTESINITFTDGEAHETELYLADLDHKHRVETVNLIDDSTGLVLNAQVVSNFSKGEYLLYDLRGPVTIQIVNDSGPSAVFSGIFFDQAQTQPTALYGTDTTTTGYNWRSQYGSQGTYIVGDTAELPTYVSNLSVTGDTGVVVRGSTKASSSLQKQTNVNSGIEAYWTAPDEMDINVDTNDGLYHLVSLYVADYTNQRRSERIEAIDTVTGDILAEQDVANFKSGEFVTFDVTGDVDFRVIRTGGPNAVVSGLFFDAPFGESVSFVGTDTTTGGNWSVGGYGLSDAYVVGDNFPGVDDLSNTAITVSGGTEHLLAVPSNSATALYKTEPSDSSVRVAAYLQTTSSMTLTYTPTDQSVHQVALYFADYENDHRTELVTISSATTNAVLSRQTVSNFHKGKYLIYNISGSVLITITSESYPNAVLSGVFIN